MQPPPSQSGHSLEIKELLAPGEVTPGLSLLPLQHTERKCFLIENVIQSYCSRSRGGVVCDPFRVLQMLTVLQLPGSTLRAFRPDETKLNARSKDKGQE